MIIISLFGLMTITGLLVAVDPPSTGERIKQVQAQVQKHNYKAALKKIDELVKITKGDELVETKRLRAMTLFGLKNYRGHNYMLEITKEHKSLAENVDLLIAAGEFCARRGPRHMAYRYISKAAKLVEARKKPDLERAADLYRRSLEVVRYPYYLPKPSDVSAKAWSNYRKRLEVWSKEIVKRAQYVVQMKVDNQRKARILDMAASHLRTQGGWGYAEKAIEIYRQIVQDYPKQPQGPSSQYYIGDQFMRFGRFVEAIREYELVSEKFPKNAQYITAAKERINDIQRPQIKLGISTQYKPGDKAKLYWQVRNIKQLYLKTRPVDLTKVFANVNGDSNWKSQIVKSVKDQKYIKEGTWSFQTPDRGKYQYHQNTPHGGKQTTQAIDIPFTKAGAYLIEAGGTSPQGVQATNYAVVLFTNMAVTSKADRDQTLTFVTQNPKGEPVNDADVVVYRRYYSGSRYRYETHRAKTGDSGLAETKTSTTHNGTVIVAVRKGDQQAIVAPHGQRWNWWGYKERYLTYTFTERPVYRPAQTVSFKHVVRQYTNGEYVNMPKAKVTITITNPKGVTIYNKQMVTDEFGTVEGQVAIKEGAPLGVYYIRGHQRGWNSRHYYDKGSQFRVEEYKKPEYKVSVSAARSDYRIGDEMKIKVAAVYYHGQPVAGASVRFNVRKQSYSHRYMWPRKWDWYYYGVKHGNYGHTGHYGRRKYRHYRWYPRMDQHVTSGTVKTDQNGEAFVTVKATCFKGLPNENIKFIVSAEVTDSSRRVIRSSGEVKVTHAPYFIYPKPAENFYGPGDKVKIEIKAEDSNSKPISGDFTVEAWRIVHKQKIEKVNGKDVTRMVEEQDQKVFEGKVTLSQHGRGDIRFIPDVTGNIRVIVRQTDAREGQTPVEGICTLWVQSKTGSEVNYNYSDLQIIPATDQIEIGETMRVMVNVARKGSYVLLTGEADDLIFHRVVYVKANSTTTEVPITKRHCPNFRLSATMMRDNRSYSDYKEIIVPPTHRFLKVELETGKGSLGGGKDNRYQPREKTEVRVKVTDMKTGKPVAGQVALMMVDSSVYYIQPEFRESIQKAFYGYTRRLMVTTGISFNGTSWITPINWSNLGRQYRQASGKYADHAEMEEGVVMDAAKMPMARKTMEKSKKSSAANSGLAKTVVRKNFKDTVLWAGSVVTDEKGTATVPVTMPDQLTTFALHAIAIDKDTKVGQTRSDVITTKRIIVRLQSGRFFTEGDHSYVTVIAHNYYDKPQEVVVDLTATDALKIRKVKYAGKWLDYKSGDPLKVTIPAKGEMRFDFQTTASRPAEIKMLARARSKVESDAIQRVAPIVPWGAAKLIAGGGVLRGKEKELSGKWTFTLPEKIRNKSQSLTVTLNPSIAAVAMESLPYLAAYPYGCVEQTMSRFLPTVVMRKSLQEAGVNLDELRTLIQQRIADNPKLAAKYRYINGYMNRNPVYSEAEVDKMILAGVKRLRSFQHSDGGWGWWKSDHSNPYITAYVLSGLAVARDCDVKLPAGMIDRAVSFLSSYVVVPKLKYDEWSWWRRHLHNDNTRAYMLYAISRAKPAVLKQKKVAEELERVFVVRDGLSDYGRALLALGLHAADRKGDAKTVIENMENTVIVDKENSRANWGRYNGWYYWYHGGVETTSWVLQAMLTVSPEDKHVPMAVKWLIHNRRDMRWNNTKATAMAVYALSRYAKVTGEFDCDQTYEVKIDGETRHTVRVTRDNLFGFDNQVELSADQLTPGKKHTITVTRKGKGVCYWNAYAQFFDMSEKIEAAGNRIALSRKYYRLVEEKFENSRNVWANGKYINEKFTDIRHKRVPLAFGQEIESGALVEVEVTIDAEDNFEYMMFEDPKPAGCEPYRLTSGASYGGGVYANMELRDRKVVFFATYLPKGKRVLSYKLVCEQPGTFRILPSAGEAMYTPWVKAISNSGAMTIIEKQPK